MQEETQKKVEQLKEYLERDIPIFPVHATSKKPFKGSNGFYDATTDPEQVAEWLKEYPNCGWAIPTGEASGWLSIDVDNKEGGVEKWEELLEENDPGLYTLESTTQSGGSHPIFKYPSGETYTNAEGSLPDGIEVRGEGGYIVVPPTPDYDWLNGGFEASYEEIKPLPDWLKEILNAHKRADKVSGPIRRGQRNSTLTSLAGSMRNRGMSEAAMLAALLEENKESCEPPLPEHEVRAIARSVSKYQPAGRPLTDVGNAERFHDDHGDKARYSHHLDAWLVWDGKRWKPDESGRAVALGQKTAKQIYSEAVAADDPDIAKKIASHANSSQSDYRIGAMLRQARPMNPISVEDLDTQPWLLNVRNGVLDLRTGELKDHDPDLLLTKLVDIDYNPDAECPRWERFMNEIMGGNQALVEFLQRFVGYTLTGITKEQAFVICYGSGSNGKSTFLERIMTMLGDDYAISTQSSTITKMKWQKTLRNDIARLRGMRFTSVNEWDKERKLDENMVKDMTGQDTLTGEFKHQPMFDFRPQFKLWIRANKLPQIDETTDAIWRRIRLVPFTEKFLKEDVDKDLPEKLEEELDGILAWAVRGALEWNARGLGEPDEVIEATNQYRNAMDNVGRFLEEETVEDVNNSVKSSILYYRYEKWAEVEGEKQESKNVFARRMKQMGIEKKRKNDGNHWLGIRLEG